MTPLSLGPLQQRTVTFTQATFRAFKTMQRKYEAIDGRPVSNSEALSRIINEHMQHLLNTELERERAEAIEHQEEGSRTAAPLQPVPHGIFTIRQVTR